MLFTDRRPCTLSMSPERTSHGVTAPAAALLLFSPTPLPFLLVFRIAARMFILKYRLVYPTQKWTAVNFCMPIKCLLSISTKKASTTAQPREPPPRPKVAKAAHCSLRSLPLTPHTLQLLARKQLPGIETFPASLSAM